jgi:hypothetical protein
VHVYRDQGAYRGAQAVLVALGGVAALLAGRRLMARSTAKTAA